VHGQLDPGPLGQLDDEVAYRPEGKPVTAPLGPQLEDLSAFPRQGFKNLP